MFINRHLPGLGTIPAEFADDLIELAHTENRQWITGINGVELILTPKDKKVEFLIFADKTLAHIKSAMGYPALYPLEEPRQELPTKAVLMDLDGTSVHSEEFWIWVIEQTTARLLDNPKFQLEESDIPHVSGHSVSEHLQHCIKKYCPEKTVEQARTHYFQITHYELEEILQGRGRPNAFRPTPGLKEFLLELKSNHIKIGLVTSGLYEKAWPEIVSAFRTLNLGDPLTFYDAIITAGAAIRPGQAGTLGELEPKPHPWLYAETARVGLGIQPDQRQHVVGIEDSAAGIISVRLAGYTAIGLTNGNITPAGTRPLCTHLADTLPQAMRFISGQ